MGIARRPIQVGSSAWRARAQELRACREVPGGAQAPRDPDCRRCPAHAEQGRQVVMNSSSTRPPATSSRIASARPLSAHPAHPRSPERPTLVGGMDRGPLLPARAGSAMGGSDSLPKPSTSGVVMTREPGVSAVRVGKAPRCGDERPGGPAEGRARPAGSRTRLPPAGDLLGGPSLPRIRPQRPPAPTATAPPRLEETITKRAARPQLDRPRVIPAPRTSVHEDTRSLAYRHLAGKPREPSYSSTSAGEVKEGRPGGLVQALQITRYQRRPERRVWRKLLRIAALVSRAATQNERSTSIDDLLLSRPALRARWVRGRGERRRRAARAP